MKLKLLCSAVAAIFAVCGPSLGAQEAIHFEESEDWEHPHGALTIPATLAGLGRNRGMAYAKDALDIGVVYKDAEHEATLYVFRKTNGSAPIWFAQANDAIVAREQYDDPSLYGTIETIAPGQARSALGLKAVYQPGEGSFFSSTGLAVFEAGGWYVKLRFSTGSLEPAQVSEWLDQALSELDIGDTSPPGTVIAPIKDCPEKLDYHNRTRDVKLDGASSILGGLLGQLAVQSASDDEESATETAEPTLWCRDRFLEVGRVSYRRSDSDRSYLFALGDNGAAVSVAPDVATILLAADEVRGSDEGYSITLLQESRNVNFVPQNKFPSPKRVLKILEKGRTTSVVSTWGEGSTIEINQDSL